jgi:hypothetical protein
MCPSAVNAPAGHEDVRLQCATPAQDSVRNVAQSVGRTGESRSCETLLRRIGASRRMNGATTFHSPTFHSPRDPSKVVKLPPRVFECGVVTRNPRLRDPSELPCPFWPAVGHFCKARQTSLLVHVGRSYIRVNGVPLLTHLTRRSPNQIHLLPKNVGDACGPPNTRCQISSKLETAVNRHE